MYGLATCRCDIYRGTTPDQFGDPKPDNSPRGRVASDVPAGVEEKPVRLWDPATSNYITVRVHEARLPASTDVAMEDRLHCTIHGDWFWVDTVTRPRAVGRSPDTVVQLRQTGM